jgi:hypothetical protein
VARRYRVTKLLEAVVQADTHGGAINKFVTDLESGTDLGLKVTYPLYSVTAVDVAAVADDE